MNKNIIAVVGLAGSGKSEAVKEFVNLGFIRVGFNDVLYEEVDRRGLKRTQEDERPVREEMRREHGKGVMAKKSLPKIDSALNSGKNVVIESLYSWSEYKVVAEKYPDIFRVLAVYTPPRVRYDRLGNREERSLTQEGARARDHAEIEGIEKAGPIAMADWTIKNIGTKEQFLGEVREAIKEILENRDAIT